MRRIKIGCILIIFFFQIWMESAIPVHDPGAMVSEAIQFFKKVEKWKRAIRQLKDLHILFENRFDSFKKQYSGYHFSHLYRLMIGFEVKDLEIKSYWYDAFRRDIWFTLFHSQKLLSKYPSLKKEVESEIVRKNPYYKANKGWAKFQEENLEKQETYIQNYQDIIHNIGFLKLGDKYRQKRMEIFQNKLLEWSERDYGPVPVSFETRMIGLWANIKFEKIMIKQDIVQLLRTFNELLLKREIFISDHIKRNQILNKHKADNVEIIKKLIE